MAELHRTALLTLACTEVLGPRGSVHPPQPLVAAWTAGQLPLVPACTAARLQPLAACTAVLLLPQTQVCDVSACRVWAHLMAADGATPGRPAGLVQESGYTGLPTGGRPGAGYTGLVTTGSAGSSGYSGADQSSYGTATQSGSGGAVEQKKDDEDSHESRYSAYDAVAAGVTPGYDDSDTVSAYHGAEDVDG